MGQIQSLQELLSFLNRRFWIILLVAALGTFGAIVYAKSRSDVYEAAAAIQIETPVVSTQEEGATSSGSG